MLRMTCSVAVLAGLAMLAPGALASAPGDDEIAEVIAIDLEPRVEPKYGWGYPTGRGRVDFNQDGLVDYCSTGGNPGKYVLMCALSTEESRYSGQTIFSHSPVDLGYSQGRTWTDANADGFPDYCRVVGSDAAGFFLACTFGNGRGFEKQERRHKIDKGKASSRVWRDINADGLDDFCHILEKNGWDDAVQCVFGGKGKFGSTIEDAIIVD